LRRLVRILARIVLALVVLITLGLVVVYGLTERRIRRTYQVSVKDFVVPSSADAVQRGERLARVTIPCFECHGDDYGGKILVNNFALGRLGATNLTRGRGGIAATHTDEDWARALLHGVRKDGRSVIFMPAHEMRMTAAALGDMVAYFRSLPPVDREMPPPRIGPMARILSYVGFPLLPAELIDHQTVAFLRPPAEHTVLAQGRHLAEMSCSGCHRPDFTGGSGPPPGASNITNPHGSTGKSRDFLRAIREHVRPNGSKIEESMPRAFGRMTDDELHAIYTYLRTVPAKGEKTERQM